VTLLLLGFKDLGFETDEGFASISFTELTRLPQADVVGIYLDQLPRADREDVTGVRKLDFRDMFRRRTRVIFFAGPAAAEGLQTPLGGWLRARLNFNHSAIGQHEIQSRTRQLVWYFENQLAYAHFLCDESYATPLADAIDATKTSIGIAALRLQHDLADVWIVPLTSREFQDDATRLMAELSSVVPYPGYLDEIQIVDETALATELREHQRLAKEIEEQIEEARDLKRILYLSDLELQHEVVQFLGEYLSVAARDIEGVKEDFRLGPRDGSADWCIGEVKGMGRANVARRHVADLVSHRSDAGFADDFPGCSSRIPFTERKQSPSATCRSTERLLAGLLRPTS
jgi:hypothetical protein